MGDLLRPQAAPIHDGLVHDYKMGEAIAKPGYHNVRRTLLDEPLDDFFFDQSYTQRAGRDPAQARCDLRHRRGQVVNLDIRRKIADLPIAGMPHLGSGITFAWNGTHRAGQPQPEGRRHRRDRHEDLATVKTIATPGPGFFMRSHENTPYAWTDSMMSPTAKDTLTIIDKTHAGAGGQVREPGARWRTSS